MVDSRFSQVIAEGFMPLGRRTLPIIILLYKAPLIPVKLAQAGPRENDKVFESRL